MDNRKKEILLHLYGEAPEDSNLRDLLRDEDLKEEYQAFSEIKFRMDHRKRERPDPAVIDAILAEAGGEATTPQKRQGDRPAINRNGRIRKLLVPTLSIAAALVIAFGLGWWANKPADPGPTTTESTGITESTTDPRLAWDEPELLEMWYRRIESLKAASDPSDWGTPAIPLEMLPEGNSSSVTPAGIRTDNRR